jgi:hypothetical protein
MGIYLTTPDEVLDVEIRFSVDRIPPGGRSPPAPAAVLAILARSSAAAWSTEPGITAASRPPSAVAAP